MQKRRNSSALALELRLSCTNHGSHKPGKVMEFNPWLEKWLNFMLTWKNGILPGKVIENQRKSLKNSVCHVKNNLNMKTLMILWLKVSFCHYIWDQIGETMLSDLHSRATGYFVADSWTTCYIVWIKPSQAACVGKASMIKAPCLWLSLMGVLVVQNTISYRENSNKYQVNLSSVNSANMYVWWCCLMSNANL